MYACAFVRACARACNCNYNYIYKITLLNQETKLDDFLPIWNLYVFIIFV